MGSPVTHTYQPPTPLPIGGLPCADEACSRCGLPPLQRDLLGGLRLRRQARGTGHDGGRAALHGGHMRHVIFLSLCVAQVGLGVASVIVDALARAVQP